MDPEWKKSNQIPDDASAAGSKQPEQGENAQPNQGPSGQSPKPLSPDIVTPNQTANQIPNQAPRPASPAPRQPAGSQEQVSRTFRHQQNPPVPPGSNPAQPANTAPNAAPQPNYQDMLSGQGSSGQGAASGSKRKIIIIAAAVVLFLFMAVGAYFLLGGNSSQNQSQNNANQSESVSDIAIPGDWEAVDTKLGFTVKAPPGWSGSFPGDFNLGGLETKNLTIGNTEEIANSGQNYDTYVTVGTQSRAEIKNHQDLKEYLEDPVKGKALYVEFGIDESQVDLSVSETEINGRKWLQSDLEFPGQVGRTMYLWVNDHAVTLSVASDNKTKLDELINDYLMPMTASVELQ